jgi:hypothetical protein
LPWRYVRVTVSMGAKAASSEKSQFGYRRVLGVRWQK